MPSAVGVGVAENDEREPIWTHGEERTTFLDEADVRAVEVGKAFVFCGGHEVCERKDLLECWLRLEEDERLLPLG